MVQAEKAVSNHRIIKAPRGNQLSCKSWLAEAPLPACGNISSAGCPGATGLWNCRIQPTRFDNMSAVRRWRANGSGLTGNACVPEPGLGASLLSGLLALAARATRRARRAAPAYDIEAVPGKSARRFLPHTPQPEQTNASVFGSLYITLAPEPRLLLAGVKRHVAMQVEGPGEHGFAHCPGKLGIRHSDDRDFRRDFRNQSLDASPQALHPAQAREAR